MLRRIPPLYWITLLLWVVYALLLAYAPIVAPIPFNLTKQTIELLRISFVLPYLAIWLAGVFAYDRTKKYADTVHKADGQKAFQYLSYGIGGLISGFIISGLVGSLKPYFSTRGVMQEILTITSNYLFIWIFLGAFLALAFGAQALVREVKEKSPIAKSLILSLPIFAVSYIWLDLIFSNPLRAKFENTQFVPTYYLNDSLIVLTIVLPSMLTWIASVVSVVFLVSYYRRVKGVIYRQALLSFIAGAVFVVASGIFLEVLISLGPGRLLGLGYGPLLTAIYALFLVLLIGFGFLARGARKLMQIETV